jgi:hypothetical protein
VLRTARPGLLLLLAGCTVIFDYGERPESVLGSLACAGDSDCDDRSSCSDDGCVDGACSYASHPDGEVCDKAGDAGTCRGGICVVRCDATTSAVCDDEEPCTVDACDLMIGECTNTAVPDNTAPSNQPRGDCQTIVCLAGRSVASEDALDVPVDDNSCTDDVCNAGVPDNPPLGAGTSCGAELVCDGNGVCVGCNLPSDCPGSDTFCRVRTCVAMECGLSDTPDGTPLPPPDQTEGPCREIRCLAGGTTVADLPNTVACDDAVFCNGTETCDGLGACALHTGDPCPGPDGDFDCLESCNEATLTCDAADPFGSPCGPGPPYCCDGGSCFNCFW